jgi:CrcB protein
MNRFLLIALGGSLGAVLRYIIGGWIQHHFTNFPAGTLVVNLLGSFLIAVVMFGVEFEGLFTDEVRIFLAIGIMGSFTTMSSFNFETFKLIEENNYLEAILNVTANFIGGFIAVLLGRITVIQIWGR